MEVAIVSTWTENIRDLGLLSSKNKKAYADKHGYHFIGREQINLTGRPASWMKLPFLLSFFDDFDWIFWTDADSLIVNQDLRLETFIDDNYEMVLAEVQPEDYLHEPMFQREYQEFFKQHGNKKILRVNCGQFFVKCSDWSRDFFAEAWYSATEPNHRLWEQKSITDLLLTKPELKQRTKCIDCKLFNFNWHWNAKASKNNSLLVHFPGYPHAKKIELMKKCFQQAI